MGESLGKQIVAKAVEYVAGNLDLNKMDLNPPPLQSRDVDLRSRITGKFREEKQVGPEENSAGPSGSHATLPSPQVNPNPEGRALIPPRGDEGPKMGRTARKNANKRAAYQALAVDNEQKEATINTLLTEVRELKDMLKATLAPRKGLKKLEEEAKEKPLPDNEDDILMSEGEGKGLIDSHFHLDRVNNIRKSKLTPRDVTAGRPGIHPNNSDEYRVMGGIMVFCDPESFPTKEEIHRLKRSPLFGITLGIHPSHSKGDIDRFIPVVREIEHHLRDGTINGIGEIGFDPNGGGWDKQEKLIQMFLRILSPETPLVLHIRGGNSVKANALAYGKALEFLLRNEVDPQQRIQLHCFTGTREVVRSWSNCFPNCFFSYSGLSKTFGKEQIDALSMVPENRLLVETDSPYLPVHGTGKSNLPSRLGEVVLLISSMRRMEVGRVVSTTFRNTVDLFGLERVNVEADPTNSPSG